MTFVYFLRPISAEGPVKIGCSQAPVSRLETYMPWSPFQLELAATIAGDYTLERRFHAKFAHLRTHHEWFTASPELTVIIAAVAAGGFDTNTLPSPKRLHYPRIKAPWPEQVRLAVSWGHRLRHLERRDVTVPRDIWEAQWRYNCGRYANALPGQPEDRALVEAFLADHPRLADVRRAA